MLSIKLTDTVAKGERHGIGYIFRIYFGHRNTE
jgi:hypothetical protein